MSVGRPLPLSLVAGLPHASRFCCEEFERYNSLLSDIIFILPIIVTLACKVGCNERICVVFVVLPFLRPDVW